MDKRSIRQSVKNHAVQNRIQKNEKVCAHLRAFLADQSGTWAGFHAIQGEPEIDAAITDSKHLQWVYPRCESKDGVNMLSFFTEEGGFETGKFGIKEPQHHEEVPLKSITGVLVPAMAYDKTGHRLGRGKGYYDRTLASFQGKRVGVVLSDFLLNEVPVEGHDLRVSCIVTDSGVITL